MLQLLSTRFSCRTVIQGEDPSLPRRKQWHRTSPGWRRRHGHRQRRARHRVRVPPPCSDAQDQFTEILAYVNRTRYGSACPTARSPQKNSETNSCNAEQNFGCSAMFNQLPQHKLPRLLRLLCAAVILWAASTAQRQPSTPRRQSSPRSLPRGQT